MRLIQIALFVAALSATANLEAQTQAPIVVQAVPEPGSLTPASAPAPVVPTQVSDATVKMLQEIKAANEAILARQAATLQQLDEIEKAAEQIKVYSKRG